MCLIFSDDKEREEVMSRFIGAGLDGNERVAYFAHDSSKEEILDHLHEKCPDVKDENLIITNARDTYCPNGEFVIDDMVKTLTAFYQGTIKEGYSGARVSGEMAWALEGLPGSDRVMEYESLGDIVLKPNPVTVICQYDARKFDGITLLNCLKVHPYMIVKGQVVQNPYYLSHDEFMKQNKKSD
jgi:hypothetical protein